MNERKYVTRIYSRQFFFGYRNFRLPMSTMWNTCSSRCHVTRFCCTLLILFQLVSLAECFDLFGKKKRERLRAQAEALRRSKLVIIFGFEINKIFCYVLTLALAAGIGCYFLYRKSTKNLRGNRPAIDGTLDVVVVGCGLPKKVGTSVSYCVHLI